MLFDDSRTNNTKRARKNRKLRTIVRFVFTWMQQQLERANRIFHLHIDSPALLVRFHERLLERLNTF